MDKRRRKFICPGCRMENFGIQDRCLKCGTPAPDLGASEAFNNGTQTPPQDKPKFCTKCGQAAKPGIKFCVKCGAEIKQVSR